MITCYSQWARLPWLSVGLFVAGCAIFWWAPYDSERFEWLILKRSMDSSWWSLLSAHFVHTDLNHLVWNMATLLILGSILESYHRLLLLVSLLLGIVLIDGWFFFQTMFNQYAGLSGALNALLVCALYAMRDGRHWFKGNEILWLVFVLALIKNVYELYIGDALFSNIRWSTTPSFHLVGMVAGGLAIAGVRWLIPLRERF